MAGIEPTVQVKRLDPAFALPTKPRGRYIFQESRTCFHIQGRAFYFQGMTDLNVESDVPYPAPVDSKIFFKAILLVIPRATQQ